MTRIPYEGLMVHYILPDGIHVGAHRAALVIKVWSEETVNLRVFYDFTNDYPGEDIPCGAAWATSVPFRDGSYNEPGTWHYIEETL